MNKLLFILLLSLTCIYANNKCEDINNEKLALNVIKTENKAPEETKKEESKISEETEAIEDFDMPEEENNENCAFGEECED